MSEPFERAAAISDARILLDTMAARGWQDAHIQIGDTEIFVSLSGRRPNPMRSGAVASAAKRSTFDIVAPHVATLVGVEPVGSRVTFGQQVATIAVLDVQEPILAEVAGEIVSFAVGVGDLLEFGAPILTLSVEE